MPRASVSVCTIYRRTSDSAVVPKILPESKSSPDPEAIRDAKGWLSQHMEGRYSPTLHQAAFSALIDIAAVRSCRSFDKLVREVEKLAGARSS